MLFTFFALLFILFIIITLKQILTFSIVIKDEAYLALDFLFFTYYIFPFHSSSDSKSLKTKNKWDKNRAFGKKFIKGKNRLLLLKELLKRSKIELLNFGFKNTEENIDKISLNLKIKASVFDLISSLFAYKLKGRINS